LIVRVAKAALAMKRARVLASAAKHPVAARKRLVLKVAVQMDVAARNVATKNAAELIAAKMHAARKRAAKQMIAAMAERATIARTHQSGPQNNR